MSTALLTTDEHILSMLNWNHIGLLPLPNGVHDQGDWQTSLDLYDGLLWSGASSPIPLPGNIVTDIVKNIIQEVF